MPQDTLSTPHEARPEADEPRRARAQVIARWNDWALVRLESGEERWIDLERAAYERCAAPTPHANR